MDVMAGTSPSWIQGRMWITGIVSESINEWIYACVDAVLMVVVELYSI